MEGAVVFGFGLFALGLFFGWLALRLWRYRDEGSISILEAALLKTTGEEPQPRTKLDHWLHYFQMVLAFIFATLLVSVSIYGLLEEAGVL
ncbi:hypothetical protein [Sphingorhabdus sp. 109]|uniref:hypothetical protein n=1 Tax=Sphingorhabdus sp. 109 TaxID=2653173 RepID=UPI0012EF0B65|nr:hypothetical protein [Sphingorhabdus sp. 109]VWX58581.1 conserved hypothetical protein [Sphingorhabdus sp. 109]